MMKLTNMTLSIPNDIYQKLKKHPEIKWSEIARRAIIEYLHNLEIVDEVVSKSQLTLEDADSIGDLIKQKIWEKHKEYME